VRSRGPIACQRTGRHVQVWHLTCPEFLEATAAASNTARFSQPIICAGADCPPLFVHAACHRPPPQLHAACHRWLPQVVRPRLRQGSHQPSAPAGHAGRPCRPLCVMRPPSRPPAPCAHVMRHVGLPRHASEPQAHPPAYVHPRARPPASAPGFNDKIESH
jgi:hypothetical protein